MKHFHVIFILVIFVNHERCRLLFIFAPPAMRGLPQVERVEANCKIRWIRANERNLIVQIRIQTFSARDIQIARYQGDFPRPMTICGVIFGREYRNIRCRIDGWRREIENIEPP